MNKLIVITVPDLFEGEAEELTRLLDAGLTRLHIRKPMSAEAPVSELISRIPANYYDSIIVHDHFQLAVKYGLGGIHLNKRNRNIPPAFSGRVSYSCHQIEELREIERYAYVFLSPIFSSLSKLGYASVYSLQELEKASEEGLINEKVVALGGIDNTTISLLKGINFGGVAVMGWLWNNRTDKDETEKVTDRFRELKSLLEA